MQIFPRRHRRIFSGAACLLMIMALIFAAMHLLSGVNPLDYFYRSYLLQAQAWLKGEAALSQDYEFLELAVYEGKYYVSFPPVPAVPMLIWTLIFGDNVPGGLIQKIYIMIAALVVLAEIQRSKRIRMPHCIAWSVGICLSSAMLPISLAGGVWYEAQILAFLFAVCAISAICRNRPAIACICYALGVGCRPFSVVLGPVLLAMYMQGANHRRGGLRHRLKRLAPGICLGLGIAACYGAYNYARFGNIFEFGHNYLPEFTRAEHGQLSLHYVAQNWRQLLLGSPFRVSGGRVKFYEFGFSMFLSCPILICQLVWTAQDIIRRRMNAAKWLIAAMLCLNAFLLMMHRTLGGHQFGLRYALELVPLCLCWYLLSPGRRQMCRWEAALLAFGLIFNFIGGCLVHI